MIARAAKMTIAGAAAGALLFGAAARAETRLDVHYGISMIGVPIGRISWAIHIGDVKYAASADGKASGALTMLVNGEGRVAVRGVIDGGRLTPEFFSSNVTDDGEIAGLQMTFENNAVKTLRVDETLQKSGRIPVSEADRQGVTDPLTAMLIGAPLGETPIAAASCDRVLAIFDGQRRYNLALSFDRIDKLTIGRGYAGPALVCGVVLEPIAGYRADSMLVKYVARRRGMEIWFMPIPGTALVMPVRVVMPTMIGTLKIDADRLEAAPAGSGASKP